MLQQVLFHLHLSLTSPPGASADIDAALERLSAAADDAGCVAACQEEHAHAAAVLALRADAGPWQRREAAALAVQAWLRRAEVEPSRIYACAARVLAERIEVDREYFKKVSARARELGAEECAEPALEAADWVDAAPPTAGWVGAWLAAEVWRRRAVAELQPEFFCDAGRLLRRYRARPDAVGAEVFDLREPQRCKQLLPVARREPSDARPLARPRPTLEVVGGVTAALGGVLAVAGVAAGLGDMAAAAGQVGVLTDTAQNVDRAFTADELRTIEAMRDEFQAGRATAVAFACAGGAVLGGGLTLALVGRASRLRKAPRPWADGRAAGVVWTGAF